ncbi:transcriptional repressor NrdR [Candidatus Pacearchaeota archaeon]|nr:MAG: transcriptional repressor NrdR [Candidatus Pacearchaeota archaeon]
MRCPFCSSKETRVVDKRDTRELVRRRRECLKCLRRFTTYEHVELDLSVIKKDGRREPFSRKKLYEGISRSLEKRPFSSEDVQDLVGEIESRIYRKSNGKDVSTKKIGEIVMAKLKRIDKVAYIRFASVYRDFEDVNDFKKEIKNL